VHVKASNWSMVLVLLLSLRLSALLRLRVAPKSGTGIRCLK
jgi:hypothetical protein